MQHEEITKIIIGCAFEVSNELGSGFLESVYEKAMCIALRQKGLSVQPQHPIKVFFRGICEWSGGPRFSLNRRTASRTGL